jgi:hypothetical protein
LWQDNRVQTSLPLDRVGKAALVAAGCLFALAGAGWAYFGTDIFLNAVMAGLAYCF